MARLQPRIKIGFDALNKDIDVKTRILLEKRHWEYLDSLHCTETILADRRVVTLDHTPEETQKILETLANVGIDSTLIEPNNCGSTLRLFERTGQSDLKAIIARPAKASVALKNFAHCEHKQSSSPC